MWSRYPGACCDSGSCDASLHGVSWAGGRGGCEEAPPSTRRSRRRGAQRSPPPARSWRSRAGVLAWGTRRHRPLRGGQSFFLITSERWFMFTFGEGRGERSLKRQSVSDLLGLLVCHPDTRIPWCELKRIRGPKELFVSPRFPCVGWFSGTWSATSYILRNPHNHLVTRSRSW